MNDFAARFTEVTACLAGLFQSVAKISVVQVSDRWLDIPPPDCYNGLGKMLSIGCTIFVAVTTGNSSL